MHLREHRGRRASMCKALRAYLQLRSSSGSGGRRPSTGRAWSSMLNPSPSLCGKAAPILVQRFWALPSLSYSSTVKTLRYVVVAGVAAGARVSRMPANVLICRA
jgi:hypothetical protein